MNLILAAVLFCFIIIGWALFFAKLLKTELPIGLFNATAFCGLAIFFGFLVSIPQTVSLGIALISGLFILNAFRTYNLPMKSTQIRGSISLFLLAGLLCLLSAWSMKFRSIDDYSFWGVMSKYLYIFQSLPQNDDYINTSFLTYTPVMACLHYLVFTMARQYSQFLGYFAQGMTFISALIVMGDFKNITRALFSISLMFILFALAYGNVLARMEVDAYVAAWFFTITWIIYKKGADALALIAIPLMFLSVIKEIGLLFSVCALLLYVVLERPKGIKRTQCIMLFLTLTIIKLIWKHHVTSYGFHSFSQGISLNLALAALNPLNTNFHFVQYLYLKNILFSNFDHILKMPWIIMYLLIASAWYYLIKNYPTKKERVNKIMFLFIFFSIIYLLMLYLLQAIVFGVNIGSSNTTILDFQRYFNMFFLPWICLTFFIGLDIIKPHDCVLPKSVMCLTLVIAIAFIVGGKIERMRKFYQPHDLYNIYSLVKEQLPLVQNKKWTLCLFNPPQPAYQITMPLTWFFMPNRVYEPALSIQNHYHCDINLKWNGDIPGSVF